MHSRALRTGATLSAALGVLAAATSAGAGTKGGLYDMRPMLNEGHPFAASGQGQIQTLQPPRYQPPSYQAPSYQAPPVAQAPQYGTTPIAPPSPTLRYTPPPRPADQASATGFDPFSPFDGIMGEGWFDRFYLSGGLGMHWQQDIDDKTTGGAAYTIAFDPGVVGQAALGTYLGPDFRAEAEVAFRKPDYDLAVTAEGDQSLLTVMGNLLYDVHLGSPFVPYLGGGLGLAQVDGADATINGTLVKGKNATEFAYQAIAGVSYEYSRTWNVGLDARYLGTSDNEVSATAITLSVRYSL